MAARQTAIGVLGWCARLACVGMLVLGSIAGVFAQPSAPANPGTPPPAKQKTAPSAQPKPAPSAQPKPASTAKPPPLVRPKGPVHAKPVPHPARPGTKAPPAASAAAAGGAAIPAPALVAPPAEPAKGTATSMPLPRFAALRSDEVNLRTGPGVRYPIDWVYKRRDLPVQIEREFEVWRLVRDPDGVKGWVHQATLTGRRSFVVTGTERVLRRQNSADAAPVARLQPGVVGHIRGCEAASDWCQMQVGDYKGWLKRDEFWGIMPGEAIN